MISGLMYWTTAARWRPRDPAMSLSKQATQTPMFAGFPNFCGSTAKIPIKIPAKTIPEREAKKDRKVDIPVPP
jgi:hypothetical protein